MLKHSAAYLAVRAVNGLLALALLALLTRLLQPEQYGDFALGLAAMTVLATALFQWLNAALARFHASYANREDELLTLAHKLFMRAVAVLLIGLVGWSVVNPFAYPTIAFTAAIGFGAASLGLHNLYLQIANARGQPLRYGLITASRAAFALGLTAVLLALDAGPIGALFAVAFACLLAIGLFGPRWRMRSPSDGSALQRQFIAFGMPVALTSLSTMILDVADRFLIALWHGSSAVAGYAAAYDLTQQTVGVVLNVFFLASYPRIVAAWEAAGAAAARAALVPLRRALLLAGPLVVGLFIGLASEVAALFFGESLRVDAAKVIPLIALAIGIGCVKAYLLDLAFHLTKSLAVLLRITAVMAVLSLLVNLILIPYLAFVGAALAVLAAFSVGAGLSLWFGRSSGLFPEFAREAIKALVALASLVIALRLPGSELVVEGVGVDYRAVVLKAGIGIATFLVVAWLIDLSQVRSIVKKRLSRTLDTAP